VWIKSCRGNDKPQVLPAAGKLEGPSYKIRENGTRSRKSTANSLQFRTKKRPPPKRPALSFPCLPAASKAGRENCKE